MNIDLSAPIWAIEHVAEAFYLSVDTAREHTYPRVPSSRAKRPAMPSSLPGGERGHGRLAP